MSIYQIAGGAFFILFALTLFGVSQIPNVLVGVAALVAGIALLLSK